MKDAHDRPTVTLHKDVVDLLADECKQLATERDELQKKLDATVSMWQTQTNRLDDALDLLVNIYDLVKLSPEMDSRVAVELAKNGIVTVTEVINRPQATVIGYVEGDKDDAAFDALRELDDLAVGGLTVGSNVNPAAIREITQRVLQDENV